jgi:hypothetical protein
MSFLPPVSTTLAANFVTSSACVVDNGGKFATGVNDTGGKKNFAFNKKSNIYLQKPLAMQQKNNAVTFSN